MDLLRKRSSMRLLLVTVIFLTVFPALALNGAMSNGHPEGAVLTARAADVPTVPVAVAWDATVPYGTTKALNGSMPLDATSPYMVNGSYRGPRTLLFVWTFNDSGNQTYTGYKVDYTWNHVGVFPVLLTVSDTDTLQYATKTIIITVIPRIISVSDRVVLEGSNRTLLAFNGSARDNTGIVSYTWTFNYGGHDYVIYDQNWSFQFSKPGFYKINLTVRDGIGLEAWDISNVTVTRLPTFYEENWVLLFIVLPIVAFAGLWVAFKLKRDKTLITPTDVEKARLQWKNFKKTWKIFRSNRLGLTGFIVLIAFAVMALFSPWISTVPNPNNPDNFEQTILSANWVNPLPPSFTASPYGERFLHPFGTDHQGQDVYSMTMYGARASLEVGLVATFISVMLGAMVGLTAGYFGRIADETLMRTTDFFLVLPWFPLMIVMMAILGKEFIFVIIVIGITSWPSTARVVRAQVLTVKERQFIVRARAVGAGDGHIIRTHILPNVLPIIFANTVLLIANAIFSESFLDFFGLGDPRVISWGGMLEGAYEQAAFLQGAWWWIAAPGAAIVLMVLAFSMVGYAIDDVLNPKLRRR